MCLYSLFGQWCFFCVCCHAAAGGAAAVLQAHSKRTHIAPHPTPQAGTGYFYVTKKNPRNVPYKLQRIKYDPVVAKRVLFSEAKMR